jgi:hypothetical protein
MALTLSDYLYRARRLLRDSLSTGYDDQFLTYCINQARADVIYRSRCTRVLPLFNLVQGQEAYSFQTPLSILVANSINAKSILTILGLTIEYSQGPLRIALEYLPWQRFNAIYRAFPIQIYPTIWSQYDYQSFWVAPIPSQSYVLECDCLYLPTDMAVTTDQEGAIPQPFSDAVPCRACYWAKKFEQSFDEAQLYAQMADSQLNLGVGATPPWRTPSQYGSSITNS